MKVHYTIYANSSRLYCNDDKSLPGQVTRNWEEVTCQNCHKIHRKIRRELDEIKKRRSGDA